MENENALGSPKIKKAEPKLEITLSELKEFVSQSQAEYAKIIADALIQSKIPYVDPRQKENEEIFRKSSRETADRILDSIKRSQASCPHKQGCNELSEVQGALSSFVFHRLDTGEVVGLCTNCQKEVRSTNPADAAFFKDKSANRMSSAGVRTFMDPRKAMLKGRLDGGAEVKEKEVV